MFELEKFLNRALISIDDLKEIVRSLKELGFKLELFTSTEGEKVLIKEVEFLEFKTPKECYNWLKPLLEKTALIVSEEEKKRRVMRHLLIDQINLVTAAYGKEVYTITLGRKE